MLCYTILYYTMLYYTILYYIYIHIYRYRGKLPADLTPSGKGPQKTLQASAADKFWSFNHRKYA